LPNVESSAAVLLAGSTGMSSDVASIALLEDEAAVSASCLAFASSATKNRRLVASASISCGVLGT